MGTFIGVRQWGIVGCAIVIAIATVPMRAFSGEPSYPHVLAQWTRHQQSFSLDNLRAELIWHATLLTPALRASRVRYEADLRGWAPEEIERALPSAWNMSGTNFFVTLYAPKDVAKLSINEENYWHLELVLPSGEAYNATAIEEVPVTPLERKLYPYLNQWTRAYMVRFTPEASQGVIRLSLKGLNARSELKWHLP